MDFITAYKPTQYLEKIYPKVLLQVKGAEFES